VPAFHPACGTEALTLHGDGQALQPPTAAPKTLLEQRKYFVRSPAFYLDSANL